MAAQLPRRKKSLNHRLISSRYLADPFKQETAKRPPDSTCDASKSMTSLPYFPPRESCTLDLMLGVS
jgi:hypothetical protein